MGEYCPVDNLKAMLEVLSLGGFSGMMSEGGLDEDDIKNRDVSYLQDKYPGISREDSLIIAYSENNKMDLELRREAGDLFRFFPKIKRTKFGERYDLRMAEHRGEVEEGIRENLGNHVKWCDDCSRVYLDYLFEYAKGGKNSPLKSNKFVLEVLGPSVVQNVWDFILEEDSSLLGLLKDE